MNQSPIYRKVASDMFFAQGIWAFNFLAVVFIIQVIKMVTSFFCVSNPSSFYIATFIASNIFMLVIGIISTAGFLPHFVSNGVTRKDYFKGTILGTIGVALAIPIVSAIVSSLMNIIYKLLNLQVRVETFDDNSSFGSGNIVGDLVTSLIFTPYVDLSSNWLLAILTSSINIFTYYIGGWLIGSAFSRLGILGIFSIVVVYILIFVEDLLLSISLGLPVPKFVESIEIPLFLSLIGILVSLGIMCWFIRLLTKRMVVK